MFKQTSLAGRDAQALDLAGYDAIVVGAGYAGTVIARELAERAGKRVCILEARGHVGGNAYDEPDDAGILVHRYGPHIYHTNSQRVDTYLSRFTQWYHYRHEVQADIHGTYTPVPFNFNSIELHFDKDQAEKIEAALLAAYPADSKVPILELRKQDDPLLHELADFVYENVFLHYTLKQWGQTPEEIDPAVSGRVPVFVGRDNRYFTDTYQGMPEEGYTPMFEHMLDFEGIDVFVDVDARDVLHFEGGPAAGQAADDDAAPYSAINVNGKPFTGLVIYTGPLDMLAGCCYGMLPYRSLYFIYKTLDERHHLPCGTVNYTVSEDYTRITEYTYLTGQQCDQTTIMEEYPQAFSDPATQTPYYAIMNDENNAAYARYAALFAQLPQFHALGRLAQYKYYNMDQIVEEALNLADKLVG
jgi:UDP-galactopyranose mutase